MWQSGTSPRVGSPPQKYNGFCRLELCDPGQAIQPLPVLVRNPDGMDLARVTGFVRGLCRVRKGQVSQRVKCYTNTCSHPFNKSVAMCLAKASYNFLGPKGFSSKHCICDVIWKTLLISLTIQECVYTYIYIYVYIYKWIYININEYIYKWICLLYSRN